MHSGVQKLPRLVTEGLVLIMGALQMAMLGQNELRMCAPKMSMIGSKWLMRICALKTATIGSK